MKITDLQIAILTLLVTVLFWGFDKWRDYGADQPQLEYISGSMHVERGQTTVTVINDSEVFAAITRLEYVISDPKLLAEIQKKQPLSTGDNPEESAELSAGAWSDQHGKKVFIFSVDTDLHIGPRKIPTVLKLKLNRHWAGSEFVGSLLVECVGCRLVVDDVVLMGARIFR